MPKVLDVYWFTSARGCVGIARVDVPYEGIMYYISAVDGLDVDEDTQYIADWGARFPIEAGDALFGVTHEQVK